MIAVPIIVVLMLFPNRVCTFLAAILFSAAAITDHLDGYIARRWNQCSDLGRILDPLIDKVNILAVLLFMCVHPGYAFPLWFFIFLVMREAAVLLGGLWVMRRKTVVMESSRPGKNSALANALTVVLFVLDLQPYAWIALWLGFALTLYSSYVYFRLFLKEVRETGS